MRRRALGAALGVVVALGIAAPASGQLVSRYRVQAALHGSEADAVRDARVIHEKLGGRQAVYVIPWEGRFRVRVGDFPSTDVALLTLSSVRRIGYGDAWLARVEGEAPTTVLANGDGLEPAGSGAADGQPGAESARAGRDAPANGEAPADGDPPANGTGSTGGADAARSNGDDHEAETNGQRDPAGVLPTADPAAGEDPILELRADGRGALEGHHEASDCTRSAGWVWDRTRPDEPLSVEIYDGGERIGTAVADVYRQGLQESGRGNGSHAFHFEHPESLHDGRVHDVSIRVDGQVLLLASPKRLACTAGGEPMDTGRVRVAPKSTRAGRRDGDVSVDGRLDEEAWSNASFRDDFLQKGHDQGYRSRVRTEVAFLYDDEALYMAARMLAPADRPAGQVRGRDDAGNDDRILVSLDTFHDLQTAYTFGLTEAGTRLDYYHPTDRELPADPGFDPVWEGRTARDSAGWTAEFRIPFSQLRFPGAGRQVWGVNVKRENPSQFVSLYWVVVPTYERGWASRFGELVGVETGELGRRVEIVPYALGTASRLEAAAGGTGGFRNEATRFGADLKVGLGPNLTLDGTINPDFGQVEADPAEVNLSAFETFFPEKRPFFQEGSQLLAGSGPNYFYSRRIGSLPRGVTGSVAADAPGGATILGAGKMTGRLESGLSVGALAAVTDAEYVPTGVPGDSLPPVMVSPTSGFGIARVQKELGPSGSTAGFMLTGLQRDLDDTLSPLLASGAVSGGADWNLRLGRGTYELRGHAGFSRVQGDPAAIDRLQQSSVHYFQRPDADHVERDPASTSLGGYSAGVEVGKVAGAPWLWEVGAMTTSPGFELNDVGILNRADEHTLSGSLSHRRLGLGGAARQFTLGTFAQAGWNYGGVRRSTSVGFFGNAVWKNFWRTYGQIQLHTAAMSDDLTRGGPLMGTPGATSIDVGLSGSHAAPTQWSFNASTFFDAFGGWSATFGGSVSMRPNARLDLSLSPGVTLADASRQYFGVFDGGPASTFGQRYVFGRLDRSEVYAQLRVGYAITPELTLELYGEPFASSARYHEFGELTGAGESTLRLYGTDGTTIEELEDGSSLVTDGAEQFTLFNSNFRLRSFRSNAVLKWEWRRGSTLHLIWQQSRWYWNSDADRVGAGSLARAFGDPGEHIFVAKLSYWLSFR